jgi:hypothetical protein
MILKNMDQTTDRNVLANCMRVSVPFNNVTAPLLYRSIRVGDTTAEFDVLYSATQTADQRKRKSLNKKACLAFVRELDILAHDEAYCLDRLNGLPKEVDVLRVSLPLPKERFTPSPEPTTNHLEYGGYSCPLAASIEAGKIVSFNTCINRPIHLTDLPQESLHTLVTAFTYDDVLAMDGDHTSTAMISFVGSKATSKRAIYILWMRHPHSRIKTGFARDPALRHGAMQTGGSARTAIRIGQTCSSFVYNLVQRAIQVDFPNDITVVNIDGLVTINSAIYSTRRGEAVMQSASTSHWKKLVEDQIAISLAPDLDPTIKASMKTPEEARKINIKYITMQTYLEEYDWTGEFTEAEVEEWRYSPNLRRNYAENLLAVRAKQ